MTRIPRPEYQGRNFTRKEWINLNGQWKFPLDEKIKDCGKSGITSSI